MYRDMIKAINDYKKKYFGLKTNEGCFFASDAKQIIDISPGVYDMCFNALEAGFMVGYRKAQRDMKKNRRS